MDQRRLDFKDFPEAVAEVDRLHASGYDKAGQWDLAGLAALTRVTGLALIVPVLLMYFYGPRSDLEPRTTRSRLAPATQLTTAASPAAAAKAYPQRAPEASMMCPTMADPDATPTEMDEESQAIPSVLRWTGAWPSTRL